MTTLLVSHTRFLDHDTGPHHPESPARLRSVLAGLDESVFANLIRAEALPATAEQVERAHPGHYMDHLQAAIPDSGLSHLDGDTVVSPGSGEAMTRAAGAVIQAVDAVARKDVANAFCAVRPPGHHAESDRPMGFCLINNAAVGAMHARAVHGFTRVAVIDIDVHHGNGTQEIFWDDANAFYASTHQYPFYPGSGARRERGAHNNVVNVPLAAGSGSDVFRAGLTDEILPGLAAFRPDFIFISAGFDAHRDDPLGGLALNENDFAWATAAIMDSAKSLCGGRVVSVLEGGYNLDALKSCATAHVQTLKDH